MDKGRPNHEYKSQWKVFNHSSSDYRSILPCQFLPLDKKAKTTFILFWSNPRVPCSLCPGWGCLPWALCTRRPRLCWIRPAAAAPPLTSALQDTPSSTARPTPSTSSFECWPCASAGTGLGASRRDRSKGGKDGWKARRLCSSHSFTLPP